MQTWQCMPTIDRDWNVWRATVREPQLPWTDSSASPTAGCSIVFKRPWRDGTTHIVMEPLELLEKVSALVPAPRSHLVRYSGVLAPASKWRPLIVPEPAIPSTVPPTPAATAQEALEPGPCRHDRNYTWAELMKRVWELDVLECPRCRGRMKIVAAIHSPNAIQKILNYLGLPSRASPLPLARLPINWNGPEKTAGDAVVGVVCFLRPRLPPPSGHPTPLKPTLDYPQPPRQRNHTVHREPWPPDRRFWTPTFFPTPAYFSYHP